MSYIKGSVTDIVIIYSHRLQKTATGKPLYEIRHHNIVSYIMDRYLAIGWKIRCDNWAWPQNFRQIIFLTNTNHG